MTRRYLYWYAPDSVQDEGSRKLIDELIDEEILAKRCFKRRKFIAPTVLSDEDWWSLSLPTLFLIGEREVTYSAQRAVRRLADVAPDVETALLPGADHHLAMAHPDWTNRKLLDFLAD